MSNSRLMRCNNDFYILIHFKIKYTCINMIENIYLIIKFVQDIKKYRE
jgi:hypothetical protein